MSDGDTNLDEFIRGVAKRVFEDTEGRDKIQIENGLLKVDKITKEEEQKNREDWR